MKIEYSDLVGLREAANQMIDGEERSVRGVNIKRIGDSIVVIPAMTEIAVVGTVLVATDEPKPNVIVEEN